MIVMPDADLDQAVDALIGAGYGSAGERCMAISVAVPVGEETANRLRARLVERVNQLRVGHSLDPKADYGPLVTGAALERVSDYIGQGVEAGAETRRRRPRARQRRPDLRRREPRRRLLHRAHPVRPRHHRHVDLHRRDLRPGAVHRPRRRTTRRPWRCRPSTSTATAWRSSPATATPPATSSPACRSAWSASTCRSRFRWPTTPSAAGSVPASATSTSTGRRRSSSTPRSRPSPQRWPSGIKDGAEFSIPTMK